MKTIAVPTAPAGGFIGPIVLVLLLLVMIVGMVLVVRVLLLRLQRQVRGAARSPEGNAGPSSGDEIGRNVDPSPAETGTITGRELKARYLRGEMSRAEFDARLRRLQIDQFQEGKE